MSILAVAPVIQGAAVIAAAVAGAAVLLVRDPRQRAVAMLAALALCGLAVATLEGDSLGRRPAAVAAAAGAGLIAVLILAAVLTRRPGLIALLAVAALPFRVPLPLGGETASLLLPLYGVIAAGGRRRVRAGCAPAPPTPRSPPPSRRRTVGCATSSSRSPACSSSTRCRPRYSTDLDQARQERLLLLRPVRAAAAAADRRRLDAGVAPHAFWLTVGLAVVFAAVGFYEYASGHLLLSNAKVLEANELQAVLPRQLAVLRPEHLRALPGR